MTAEYPGALWIAAAAGNFTPARRSSVDINLIVIHITDGGATRAEQTARWFANPNQKNAKGEDIAVSAHYVVGRAGEVVQCVRHNDIAHHAHPANRRSIGIEHVVPRTERGLTDVQYEASAQLVHWLGGALRIPLTGLHIRGHAHVSLTTTHRSCPDRAFDWTRFWIELSTVGGPTFDEIIAAHARGRI